MVRKVLSMRFAAPALALAGVLAAASPAAAFDTGHHFDLTDAVLTEHGLGRDAVRQAQVANWITDYLNTPVYPDRALARKFDLMHFDDLAEDEAVRARWAGVVRNTRRVVEDAARRNDPEDVITALGMSLHGVQDFYSHSNWVDLHPRRAGAPYGTVTYLRDPNTDGPLRTSLDPKRAHRKAEAHGDYFKGMNKDSHVRAGWRDAYVFAHAATHEWTDAVRGWAEAARPGIWARCRAWRADAAAARDLRRQVVVAQRLSSWGSAGLLSELAIVRKLIPTGADGHWKGNGSGDFVATLLASLTGPSPRASAVATRAIALVPGLVEGLAEPAAEATLTPRLAAAAAGLATPPIGGRAVIVRTLGIRAMGAGLDPTSPPDFYSRVTIGKQRFLEAPQIDRDAPAPAWTSLAVTAPGARRVPITYTLVDEDYPDVDDPVDLTPTGPLRFWYEPATGRVGGLPPGARVAPSRVDGGVVITVRGAAAEVRLRVSSGRLAEPGGRLEVREAGI